MILRGLYVKKIMIVTGLVLTQGCASIVSKSTYPVTISTTPEPTEIQILDESENTVYQGMTPANVVLSTKKGYFKGKDYTINISSDKYGKITVPIKRSTDMWYAAGNIVLGGLIGWLIVDPATGAMWKLEENVLIDLETGVKMNVAGANLENVEENVVGQAPLNDSRTINVVTIDQIPEEYKQHLIRVN